MSGIATNKSSAALAVRAGTRLSATIRNMIRYFVSTFGKNCDWIKNATAIEVGAATRPSNTVHYTLADDSGDSISKDNAYWGELTGIYWIWKNVPFADSDIIGFAHYNKTLDITMKRVKTLLMGGAILGLSVNRFRYHHIRISQIFRHLKRY